MLWRRENFRLTFARLECFDLPGLYNIDHVAIECRGKPAEQVRRSRDHEDAYARLAIALALADADDAG